MHVYVHVHVHVCVCIYNIVYVCVYITLCMCVCMWEGGKFIYYMYMFSIYFCSSIYDIHYILSRGEGRGGMWLEGANAPPLPNETLCMCV